MNQSKEQNFLDFCHSDSLSVFKKATKDGNVAVWDNVLITTASRSQAELYTQLLQSRKEGGFLPKRTRFLVVPDQRDERIGSGGSTLCALVKLYELNGNQIDRLLRQKTLILHSGGDAKRMPHSAPFGKLFSLIGSHIWGNRWNPPAAMFDELMVSFSQMPGRMNSGIVVVSADACFRFSDAQIDLDTVGSVAFSMRASLAEGTKHGVFLEKDHCGYVTEFLHKLSECELRERGAVYEDNTLDLDIGVTYLGADVITALLSLVVGESGETDRQKLACYANQKVQLSFYGDIIYPMASESTLESYMRQAGDGLLTNELLALRPILYQKLHQYPLQLCRLSPGCIQNMGTSLEAIEMLEFLHADGGQYGFNPALIRYYEEGAEIGTSCFIENSIVKAGAKIGSNCLLSNCEIDSTVRIGDNFALHCLKLLSGNWVCRVWGVQDDLKSSAGWLNRPVCLRDWDEDATSLWSARLFPVCAEKREAIRWAEILIRGNLSAEEMTAWRSSPRLSLADTQQSDVTWLIQSRAANEDKIRADLFASCVLQTHVPSDVAAILGSRNTASRRVKLLLKKADNMELERWQDKMRLFYCIAEVVEILDLDEFDGQSLREKGLAVLCRITEKSTPRPPQVHSKKWMREFAETSLPIRVNFGGTWSDAPPYCFEHGGTMLNAAVALGGKRPIYVSAELLNEPIVHLKNKQSQNEIHFTELEPLLSFSDPSDQYILFKTALSVAGVLEPGGGTLEEQLGQMGGGIKITTDVNIPRGSGLGTSSIIEAGIIDTLFKLMGVQRSQAELSDDVLLAEQLMTTGGGWQDVIGGVYPGIKLTFTQPGIPQSYQIENIQLSRKTLTELNEKGFLLYTGQRRLARSVLRRVVANYICNHTASLTALHATQRLAVDMAYELRRSNLSAFGEMLSEHMRLLKELDNSSSNSSLDYIMKELSEFAYGMSLCGAAGGGFLYGILKDGYTLHNIDKWNHRNYNGSMEAYKAVIVLE